MSLNCIHFLLVERIPISRFRSLVSTLLKRFSIFFPLLRSFYILPHMFRSFRWDPRQSRTPSCFCSSFISVNSESEGVRFFVWIFLLWWRIYPFSISTRHFCMTFFFVFLFAIYFRYYLLFDGTGATNRYIMGNSRKRAARCRVPQRHLLTMLFARKYSVVLLLGTTMYRYL